MPSYIRIIDVTKFCVYISSSPYSYLDSLIAGEYLFHCKISIKFSKEALQWQASYHKKLSLVDLVFFA